MNLRKKRLDYFLHSSSSISCLQFLPTDHLFYLQSDRLKQVQQHLDTLNALCLVLGMDFKHTASAVHTSFGGDSGGPRDISNQTIQLLATAIHKLREVKIHRMQKVSIGLNLSIFDPERFILI